MAHVSQPLQNVVGHFLLSKLLLPVLIRTTESNPSSGKARIITTSGSIYKMYPRVKYDTIRDGPARRKLSPDALYAQSKFGNILMSNELARRYEDKIVAITLHPGIFQTELQRHKNLPERGPIKWILVRNFRRFYARETKLNMLVKNAMTSPVWMGALNQLYAGTAPEAESLNGKVRVCLLSSFSD